MRFTSRAIIIRDEKILVIARARLDNHLGLLHYYSIPGGAIEPDENSEQAVVRELHEELLVNIQIDRYLGVIHLLEEEWGDRQYQIRTHYFYLCSGVVGLPKVSPVAPEIARRLPGDLQFEAVWVPLTTPLEEFHPDYAPIMAWIKLNQNSLQTAEAFEIEAKASYNKKNQKGE